MMPVIPSGSASLFSDNSAVVAGVHFGQPTQTLLIFTAVEPQAVGQNVTDADDGSVRLQTFAMSSSVRELARLRLENGTAVNLAFALIAGLLQSGSLTPEIISERLKPSGLLVINPQGENIDA